jgi:hypothetical protein
MLTFLLKLEIRNFKEKIWRPLEEGIYFDKYENNTKKCIWSYVNLLQYKYRKPPADTPPPPSQPNLDGHTTPNTWILLSHVYLVQIVLSVFYILTF